MRSPGGVGSGVVGVVFKQPRVLYNRKEESEYLEPGWVKLGGPVAFREFIEHIADLLIQGSKVCQVLEDTRAALRQPEKQPTGKCVVFVDNVTALAWIEGRKLLKAEGFEMQKVDRFRRLMG